MPVQFLACQHTEVRKRQTHRVPARALIRFLVQLRVKRPPPVQRTVAVHVHRTAHGFTEYKSTYVLSPGLISFSVAELPCITSSFALFSHSISKGSS